ncbi:hypothetical protein Tco_0201934 [Tanacetum coccineum]
MTNMREMTPQPGFSTLTSIPGPNTNELQPIIAFAFTPTSPKNMSLTHRASTSTNPNPMTSPAFVEANHEILESLLRERQKQIRNADLRTELEYFSEEYDKEREKEPRPIRVRETTPVLHTLVQKLDLATPKTCDEYKESQLDIKNIKEKN